MASKRRKSNEDDAPNPHVRYFVVDLNYEEGREFGKHLLEAGAAVDFIPAAARSCAGSSAEADRRLGLG